MMKLVLPYGLFKVLSEAAEKEGVSTKAYIVHVLAEHFKNK